MLCSEKNPTVSVIMQLYINLLNLYFDAYWNNLPAVAAMKAATADDMNDLYSSTSLVF